MSRLTEESTSAARQREIIEQWADSNGHEVIGWAEDIDVSGSVDPFEAPALGRWFDRADEWDILCAWKLDRYGRNAIKLNKLFGWCLDHHKTLVSCSEGIDLSTPVGRLIANVIAFLAEGELEAIRERTRASRRKLLEDGRWPGGTVPFGFEPYPLPEGGWKLRHHPQQVKVVRDITQAVIDGHSIASVAEKHNMLPQSVWNMITSKYLLGHATYEGTTVRDRAGMPVLYAEPVLTEGEWDRLQKQVKSRRQFQKRTAGVSPMYGVAFCSECSSQLYTRTYHKRGKSYRYYFCQNKHGRNIPADAVEKLVFDEFIHQYGDDPVLDKVYVPAEDHQIELEAAERAYEELSGMVGTLTSDRLRSRVTEQIRALDLEIARLEKMPARKAGWDYRETGSTFRQVWLKASTEEKRQMIIAKQITAHVIRISEDIEYWLETQKSPPAS